MKKVLVFGLIVVSLAGAISYYFLNRNKQKDSGRAVIYPADAIKISEYPGTGKVIWHSIDQLLVDPVDGGVPFLAELERRSVYENDPKVKITEIPAQDQVMYAVGKVVNWEEIKGSSDYYLVVDESPAGGTEKYRVGFEASALFGDRRTMMMTEDTVNKDENGKNKIDKLDKYPGEIGIKGMKKLLKAGDAVIVEVVEEVPVLSKKDEAGYYLVAKLVLRRAGGKATLEQEISKLKSK